MKRYNHITEKTASLMNIMQAVWNAEKHCGRRRSYKEQVDAFNAHFYENIAIIQKILLTGDWPFHGYRMFERRQHEKVRKIDWNPSFIDSVIQHAIYQTAGKILEKSCIIDTFSGFKKRGMTYGAKRVRKFLKTLKGKPIYIWKADIKGYYEHIQIDVLYNMIERKFKDRTMLKLFHTLLYSHPNGLPIGNLMSQVLANFYMNEIDHWAKEVFGMEGYFHFCDDFVAISDDKQKLKRFALAFAHRIDSMGLWLKPNQQVFPITRYGIDFMGYVFRRYETRLRRCIERGFRRRMHLYDKHPCKHTYSSVASYYGWCKHITHGEILWNKVTGGRTTRQLYEEAKHADKSA